MSDFDYLVMEYKDKLSPKGRFIKKNNFDFVEKIKTSFLLTEFSTIDEKLWALKNNCQSRPICYCGNLTNFHSNQSKYHRYCGSSCAVMDPTTLSSRVNKRIKSGAVEKIIESLNTRYGKEEMIYRRRQGIVKKYGVDNYFATEEFKNRIKDYNLKKYGVEYYTQTEECKLKIKETCLKKYQASSYMKSDSYQQKKQEIYQKVKYKTLSSYGVEHTSQIKIKHLLDKLNDTEWLYEQYIIQSKSSNAIAEEYGVSATTVLNYLHRAEIDIKSLMGYSYKCIEWLSYISQMEKIYIQHAINDGEFTIPGTRFRADGYCEENNTIYEFHGNIWHGNPRIYLPEDRPNPYAETTAGQLYEKTLIKESIIRKKGFNLVVMWEDQWDKIKEHI